MAKIIFKRLTVKEKGQAIAGGNNSSEEIGISPPTGRGCPLPPPGALSIGNGCIEAYTTKPETCTIVINE